MALALCVAWATQAGAASWERLDKEVRQAIHNFYATVPAARELASEAAGMLVFPGVVAGGLVVGGEYGEGALIVGGRTVDYYNTASASLGLTVGAQMKTQVLLFMSARSLAQFRASRGWEIGVDGEVALARPGAEDTLDRDTLQEPIIAFVFSNKGLMYNLSLEGSKFTRFEQ
jgi:lipid-binding SYLF domain-containing protein